MPMNPRTMRPTASALQPLWIAAAYPGEGGTGETTRVRAFVFISRDGKDFISVGPDDGVLIPERGINDPTVLWWRGKYYMCYSDGYSGWSSNPPTIHIVQSNDLVAWTPVVEIAVGSQGGDNIVNIPTWVVDDVGPAIVYVPNSTHYVEVIRPTSTDPATWGSSANWSTPVAITGASATALVQGNTFIAYKAGTYYMAFNDVGWSGYKKRTSSSLLSGWGAESALGVGAEADGGDTLPLVITSDGKFRAYVSNGNFHTYEMWYYESDDFATWGSAVPLTFAGASAGYSFNWAHISIVQATPSLTARLFAEYTPQVALLQTISGETLTDLSDDPLRTIQYA